MEAAQMEARPKAAFGVGPQLTDLALTQLVRQRLARPSDVAIHFIDDVVVGHHGVLAQKGDGAVPTPAECVDARVHHQPTGPPGVEIETPQPLKRTREETELVGEPFRVKAPTLDERRHPDVLAELGDPRELLSNRNLNVVAGNG